MWETVIRQESKKDGGGEISLNNNWTSVEQFKKRELETARKSKRT